MAPRSHRKPNLQLAVLFWGFTYALFAYRANLRYGDAYELFSAIRLVSTAVGAGLYWMVLTRLIDGTSDRPGKPLAVLATILPASIVVLLARLLLDYLGASNPNGLPGDMRFVLVWSGYFGLWVSASFALRVMPRMTFGSQSVAVPRQGTVTRHNAIARAEILERLALEIATLPTNERKALIESFAVRTSYEVADEFENPVRR
jgi:hypothetical protein